MTELVRILHIEDDPSVQEVVRVSLEDVGGFTVATRSSGRDGLAAAGTFLPQLVLLDVMMPEMDGPETLARLRALPGMKDVPVVFMTARAQHHEVAEYLALGAAAVITKPFDPMTLPERLRTLWRDWQSPQRDGAA